MERNLDRRVEVLCPVRDRTIAAHIRDTVLNAHLQDNERAYVLNDDRYQPAVRQLDQARISAQDVLLEYYTSGT